MKTAESSPHGPKRYRLFSSMKWNVGVFFATVACCCLCIYGIAVLHPLQSSLASIRCFIKTLCSNFIMYGIPCAISIDFKLVMGLKSSALLPVRTRSSLRLQTHQTTISQSFNFPTLFGGRISCKKLHNYDYRKKLGATVPGPVCMQQAVPKDQLSNYRMDHEKK